MTKYKTKESVKYRKRMNCHESYSSSCKKLYQVKQRNMFRMIVILLLLSVVDCIRIGKIENNIMIGIINNSLSNITLDQCICQMVQSNELISAVNYFQTNQTCQLFSYNMSSILIQFNVDSTIIFINQTSISITSIQSNGKFICTVKPQTSGTRDVRN
jgi:hypothetical protein